mmetsp:Transcript_19574/g.42520  ORF Transcript_19574/g.42520 Transcript_19574/m.42520 type:complete len:872 (+) Transcript_19574:244-2859(+)|eukprot:CAMPEP_0172320412 /NCGR_PEP_ID=MMETSP1058-20130122/40531_1 /TAXON_ID=83371 /ORGANISM="Detonula confervacea, Strain CCMP 353" /LENGTH=871 /DNA_ID=CAMNT_0013035677 /DNA_START=146 /DNA_END=2761 /DNA_ORIENTATION=-
MNRNFRPPPPRHKPKQKYDTIDSLFERQTPNNDDSMKKSSMNDIDGDDEATEVSDNDSVLAMAKRLDAASVISDPSIIEGTSPHLMGVDPLGYNRGDNKPAGGLYAQDRDLDSIASESDNSSSSSSSSGSSSDSSYSAERNPHRGKQRPMGQPRVGFHDGNNNSNYRSPNHRQARGERAAPPPPPGQPPGSYIGGGGERAPPYQDNRRGYIDPGPPEYNPNKNKNASKNVRFSERGQRRVFRDHKDGPGSSGGSAGPPPPNSRSRSQSPSGRSKSSSNDKENENLERKRRMKMIAIPFVVCIAIGLAVAIAVIVGKQGGDDSDDPPSKNDEFLKSLPTSSPTYKGLYNCPIGKSGPVPTKGCLGFVQCNLFGEAPEPIILCPSGTLYDVDAGVCNFMDQVKCTTRLPPLPTRKPTSRPVTLKPTIASFVELKPSAPELEDGDDTTEETTTTELLGPTPTYDQKLVFIGVSSPGDMTLFEQNLENYLNIFYSPGNLALLDEDDELQSLSEVRIDVTVTDLERRRFLVGIEDANMSIQPSIRGTQQHRRQLQAAESPQFIAVYDQTTTYRTSDPSISIDTIVSRPFDPEYSAELVEQLKRRDPLTFASLTSIEFVEGSDQSTPETATTAAPTAAATTTKPTNEPTKAKVETGEPTPFDADTSAPTKYPTPSPTVPVIEFPAAITIQGLLWLDENENGLFETTEPPMESLFVNLRECDKDRWKATTTTNKIGQYQFVGVDEGEYYVDFFKPNPIEKYGFTLPRMGGNDDRAVDSDVVKLDGNNGKSECMDVKKGFNQLINAGYYLYEETPAPTPSPTTPKPSVSPTTKTPTVPRFCAFVSGENFNFQGCSLPCTSPNHEDCPDGMLCALTSDCS